MSHSNKSNDRFSEFLDVLGKKLPQYLHDVLQIDTTKTRFLCLNPEHKEENPAMGFVPDPDGIRLVKCFACGACYNLFSLVYKLKGWPNRGPEFVTVTLRKICEELGMEMPSDLQGTTESDVHASWIKRVYRQALEVLREYCDKPLNQPDGDRGWTTETKREWGIATIPWTDFIYKLKAITGTTNDELSGIDIRVGLFSENGVTYTIFDQYGDPVGFSFRDARHRPGNKQYTKFTNTSGTRCPIFKKGHLLYGFHKIAHENSIRPELVEGFADVVTAYQAGLKGFCALIGTELTYEAIELLGRHGKTQVVLALDHDKPGLDATDKAIGRLADHQGCRAYVRQVAAGADEKFDPDDWLRTKGASAAQAWNSIPLVDGFSWMLERSSREEAPSEEAKAEQQLKVVEASMPLIVAEPNNVRREQMLKRLFDHLKGEVRMEALQRQLDDEVGREGKELRKKAEDIRKKAERDSQRAEDPAQVARILGKAANDISQLRADKDTSKVAASYSLTKVDEIFSEFSRRDPVTPGHQIGIHSLDSKLRGGPRNELWVIAGIPNIGKSSLLIAMGWEMVKRNPNLCVLYFSTDDPANGLIAKIMAMETGFVINSITSSQVLSPQEKTVHDKALQRFRKVVAEGRWDIRDSTDGTSIDFLENWVRETRRKYPNRDIVVCADSIQKISSNSEGSEAKRLETMDVSKRLKKLAVGMKVGVLATAEMNKQGDRKRPMLKDISETISIEYDASVIMLFHQDLHMDANTSNAWEDKRVGPDGSVERLRKPNVDLYVDKNKCQHSGWKGRIALKFDPERCIFSDVDYVKMSLGTDETPGGKVEEEVGQL